MTDPRDEESMTGSTPRTDPPNGAEKARHDISKSNMKRATRTRRFFIIIASLCFFVSLVFLCFVEAGNTTGRLRSVWFLKVDLTNIVPQSVPNAVLINSIARTLGLHDFYTVGLWNFCEGYNDEGITYCSKPTLLYWFNPVDILLDELLAGATIALPAQATDLLNIVRIASRWMFGLYMAGLILTSVSLLVAWTSIISRWAAIPNSILTFLAALTTTVACVIATIMFVIFRNALISAPQLNIGAEVGLEMFVFMWISSGALILGWLLHSGMCCCCTSKRDIRKGFKQSKHISTGSANQEKSVRPRRGWR